MILGNGVMEPASRWRRFFNWVVDYVGVQLAFFIFEVVAILIKGQAAVEHVSRVERFFAALALTLVYYLTLESLTGRTLGKLVTGTRVVDETGEHPSFTKIAGRTLARLIPFEWLSLFEEERRMWHDSMPGTHVIRVYRGAQQVTPAARPVAAPQRQLGG